MVRNFGQHCVAQNGDALTRRAQIMGGMTSHRIRELRKSRGMTLDDLAEKVGRSRSAMSRIENGETGLNTEMAYAVARALGATVDEVLGLESVSDPMTDDGARYDPPPGDPLSSFVGPTRFLFRAATDLLNLAGVHIGDVLAVDERPEACKHPKPLQIVLVQFHPQGNGHTVLLLRQFVPPRLVITNASAGNLRSIDLGADQATVVGVVGHVVRSLS